ncbi:unnamed protein product [Linum trigynum]|uniref:Uncharacterized protein n=1 Tax=Linum trigynum TaxID=586398 RepID=A0AAV2D750_9ROSI
MDAEPKIQDEEKEGAKATEGQDEGQHILIEKVYRAEDNALEKIPIEQGTGRNDQGRLTETQQKAPSESIYHKRSMGAVQRLIMEKNAETEHRKPRGKSWWRQEQA